MGAFNFLCLKNGFFGRRQNGAGAFMLSRLQVTSCAWQDVAQPGRSHLPALPCLAAPHPQAACMMTSLGKALSAQHLSAAV